MARRDATLQDLAGSERGSVVISPDGLPAFDDLVREFDVFDFLNLCSTIDAAVLHPRLFAAGLYDQENPVQATLVEEGVLTNVSDPGLAPAASPAELPTFLTNSLVKYPVLVLHLVQQEKVKLTIPLGEEKVFTSALAYVLNTARVLYIEPRLPLPLSPTTTESLIWRSHPIFRREDEAIHRAASSLPQAYESMADTLIKVRADLEEPGLAFPPLALEALHTAKSREDLGPVVMRMREKYAGLRRRFSEMDAVLAAEDSTLREKLAAKARLQRLIQSLQGDMHTPTEKIDNYVSLARGLNDSVAVEKLLDGLQAGDIGISKVAGRLLSVIPDLVLRLQLRALHGTKKVYLNLSSDDIRQLVERHFGYHLTDRDTRRVRGFQSLVHSMMDQSDKLLAPDSPQEPET
jgi:hypothetical protein